MPINGSTNFQKSLKLFFVNHYFEVVMVFFIIFAQSYQFGQIPLKLRRNKKQDYVTSIYRIIEAQLTYNNLCFFLLIFVNTFKITSSQNDKKTTIQYNFMFTTVHVAAAILLVPTHVQTVSVTKQIPGIRESSHKKNCSKEATAKLSESRKTWKQSTYY